MAELASNSNVISHWHHPLENFQTSAMEFYAARMLSDGREMPWSITCCLPTITCSPLP